MTRITAPSTRPRNNHAYSSDITPINRLFDSMKFFSHGSVFLPEKVPINTTAVRDFWTLKIIIYHSFFSPPLHHARVIMMRSECDITGFRHYWMIASNTYISDGPWHWDTAGSRYTLKVRFYWSVSFLSFYEAHCRLIFFSFKHQKLNKHKNPQVALSRERI